MDLLEHLAPHPLVHLHLFGLDLSISNHVLWMWISCVSIIVIFKTLTLKGGGLVPEGFYNIVEVVVEFVRDQIVIPNMGKEEAKTWFPFICTLFLFVWFNNLLGLVPGSATATSNINVTATLAILVFLVVQAVGVSKHGFFRYVKGWVPAGIPIALAPPLFIIETIGQFAKPFSLAIRLFANMFAGHAVLLVFLNLIIMSKSYLIGAFPLCGAVMVSALEIGFATIQAYIFAVLSALYLGEAIHPSH